MGDKDELSEFMQEYGNDYSTALTMGQLQRLVSKSRDENIGSAFVCPELHCSRFTNLPSGE